MPRRTALTGKKASVIFERNGAVIRIDDLDAKQAAAVLADLIEAFRLLSKRFEELTPDLTPVAGGTPVDVVDDDWAEEGHRRVGFQTEGASLGSDRGRSPRK